MEFRNMEKENALPGVASLDSGGSNFAKFVKFVLIDFIINTMRITPFPTNEERTLYVEHIVQLFKYFSNISGLLSFSWCERKDKDAATSIFFLTQEKSTTTLLDGIGRNKKCFPCIVIESSGFNITANIDHTLEDSIKNIKSATDALKCIMCKYPNSSFNTFKKVNVYSIQVIQTTITLMKYSLKDKNSFKAVECCSVSLPASFEDRLYMLAVYFYLHITLKNHHFYSPSTPSLFDMIFEKCNT